MKMCNCYRSMLQTLY